jgi:hypothetical protein
MKGKIIFSISAVFFFCIFITPFKVRAACDLSAIRNEYSARGLSGSGIEQQAIDSCLSQQRQLDQQARDQQNSSSGNTQTIYQIQYITPLTNTVPTQQPVKSNDQICSDKFGQNWKWNGTTNSQGGLTCGCKDGYTQTNGSCVVAPITPLQPSGTLCNGKSYSACPSNENLVCPSTGSAYCEVPKTNDQICQDKYGSNSNWDGTRNDKGGLVCDCNSGYQWNTGMTSCVAMPQTPQPTNDQPVIPVVPVVPTSSDTTVHFTYHANRAEPITERDMALISSANLRSCPNETCKSLGNYPQGTVFAVTQRYNDVFGWYGGTTSDGKEGWIYPGLLTDRVDVGRNEIASSSTTSSQSVLSVQAIPAHVNMQVSTSTNTLPQKGFWARVRGWFGF